MAMGYEDIYGTRYGVAMMPPVHPALNAHFQVPYHRSDLDSSNSLVPGDVKKKRGCCGCISRPILLNNVALTFLLIAGLGLLAALSMGAFFALKPRFAKSEPKIAFDARLNNTATGDKPELAKLQLPKPENNFQLNPNSQNSVLESSSDSDIVLPSSSAPGQANPVASPNLKPAQASSDTNEVESNNFPPIKVDREPEIVEHNSAVQLVHSSRNRNVTIHKDGSSTSVKPDAGASAAGNGKGRSSPGRSGKPEQGGSTVQPRTISRQNPSDSRESSAGNSTKPKVLQDFGKVVGIAFREGYLYVPSYQTGKITVLTTPDLRTIQEYKCEGCSIYDIAVLSTGAMILAQGRQQLLSKMDPATGKVVKEVSLSFSTKGLAISSNDEIYVIPRSHDAVHIFDAELRDLGSVPIPTKGGGDCNFLAVNSTGTIFVSCQDGVYCFSKQGDLNYLLEPPPGVSYAVGITTDESDNVMVVRRGQGVLDIFNSFGEFVEAVGENAETLWSDIAAGDGYLYAVDYIEAKIKVFRYL